MKLGSLNYITRLLWAGFFIVLVTSNLAAQELPDQKIIGAEEPVPRGDIVILKVSDVGNVPNLKSVSYAWIVIEDGKVKKRVAIWPNGTQIVFGNVAKYSVTVYCHITYVFQKDDKIDVKHKLLSVDLKLEKPEPPKPPNPPRPSPDSKYGLDVWVKNTVLSMNLPNTDVVSSFMSDNFRSISSAISAGVYQNIEQVLKATSDLNNKSFARYNIDSSEWNGFNRAIQKKLYDLYSSKKMTTMDDFAQAWLEISEGFASV